MSHLFYCFLVQFDLVVLKKKIFLSRVPLGVGTYVPMSLWPYMSLYTYVPSTYVPSLDFKTCSFVNN